MNIYFGCATQKIIEYRSTYEQIRQLIQESGHNISRDWIPEAIEEALTDKGKYSRPEMYDEVMNSILQSDLAIFECSVPGMSIGHQVTFAIEKSKPTLILLNSDIKKSEELFIAGTKSPYLHLKNYANSAELSCVISSFLATNSPTSKARFNLALERELNNYLEWASFKYHLSKTEILKSAIRNKLGADTEYQKRDSID